MRFERLWYTLPLRLRSIFRGRQVERELDEEMQFHLEARIEAEIARGLSPEEARYAALRAMDGLDQKKEAMRDLRGVRWLTDFVADVRYALRSLRRTPGLTAFVVITIAVGIGMTATPLSFLDALVFRPYPVPHPGSVMTLVSTSHDSVFDAFSYREYVDLRDHTKSYEGVVASALPTTVGFSADPAVVARARGAMLVSGNYFRVLGVEPSVGRGFRDGEDEVPGRDAVMVLGPDFWRNEFGSDPSVVGRTVRVNGRDFTIVGVATESFPGMMIFVRPDVYLPLAMARLVASDARKDFFTDRDDRGLIVRGRLRAGVTQRQAQSEIEVLARGFERDYPALNRDRGAAVRTQIEMRTRGDSVEWKFGVIFNVLSLTVLLVACTNVAGLLLSRGQTRTREIAVRLALGAGRFRLVRLLLTESLVLACLGGLGGIGVGYWLIDYVRTFTIPSELPIQVPFRMDARVLLAALVLSVVSAVFCGLAPALQSTRTDLVKGLKTADVDSTGRRRLWGRNALVVAQVALSMMLLAGGFLMFRGFHRSFETGTEFPKDRLLVARFDPRLVQYDAPRTRQFYERLTERAKGMAGVERATLAETVPLQIGSPGAIDFVPDGFTMPRDRRSFTCAADTVDEEFFTTLGIPILRGRGFHASDTADAPQVAVVNEQFAKHYWPGEEAVGKRLRLESETGAPIEVVGVVRTIKYQSTIERPMDFVYLPLAQHPLSRVALLLRSTGDPLRLVGPLETVVRDLAPNMPMLETRSYEDFYRYNTVDGPGVAVNMVGLLGLVGLVLAIVGLYGLVAYTVSGRTREIGIRMAIGARPRDILRLVMGKGVALVGTGTAIGLALGLALDRLMNALLFNAGGVDIAVFAIVVPSMLLATLLAASVPARRAARISPTEALRC